MNKCLTKLGSQLTVTSVFKRNGCVAVLAFACFAGTPFSVQAGIACSDGNVPSVDVLEFPTLSGVHRANKMLLPYTAESMDGTRTKPLQLATLDGEGGTPPPMCVEDGVCIINGCQQTPDPDCGDLPTPPSGPVERRLSISRYTTATLDNASADAILAKASNALQNDNSGDDVACDVTFTRDGNVTTFSTGDGSIDIQSELDAVFALPGEVKLVNAINWCNGIVSNAYGCAPIPGSSFVVVRFGIDRRDGLIWAHEYGHNRGLPDRTISDYVMSGSNTPRSTRINSTECDAYRN